MVRAAGKRKCRQLGLSKIEWIVLLLMVLIGGGVVMSISKDTSAKSRIVEEQAAPLIVALRQYRTDNNAFPKDLSLLVPRYVRELPGCSQDSEVPMRYMFDENTKAFWLICPVGSMFHKRGFNLSTGKWHTFDDSPPSD
jgi:hypothetical protein